MGSVSDESDRSSASSPKRPGSRRIPILSRTRPLYLHILVLFLCVKTVVFSLACLANWYIPSNNTATDLILVRGREASPVDRVLKQFLTPLIRWDAIHMLAIARDGYMFENQFAFFPLLPLATRAVASGLGRIGLLRWISHEALLGVSAILFVNIAHYLAALVLFKLTVLLFKSTKFAMLSCTLFIVNPAAIQLSTMYSEAPFALLVFSGLLSFYSEHRAVAALCWALAAFTRSNGIVLVGFFVHDCMQHVAHHWTTRKLHLLRRVASTVLYSAVVLSGFVVFQAFAYRQFCTSDATRPWCHRAMPVVYTFVQKEYWNVGLFNYFQLAQIPNFLLALPMIVISAGAVFVYFEADHLRFLSCGLHQNKNHRAKQLDLFKAECVLPHIYLLLFMLLYNVFIAHVQIVTRLFTFQPVLYWFMAHVMMTASIRVQKTLQTYIGLYGLIGTVLFATHYPPA